MKENKIDYDKNADVLYITFSKYKKKVTADGDFMAGIIIWTTENSIHKKVTGITIDGFAERIKKGYIDYIVRKLHPYIDEANILEIYNNIDVEASV